MRGLQGGAPLAMACVLVLLMVAPAQAQVGITNPKDSTPTTLYFHLDAGQDFPINTQPPDDRFSRADSVGLTGLTTSCIPDPSGQAGVVSQSFHTTYGFSTPGYVEYDFSEQGGPRIHPERGLAYDVVLDQSAPATLYWYLETQVLGDSRNTPPQTETLPVVVPQVTVRATMRSGDDISVGAAAYNAGSIIMQGTSEPMLVQPDANNPHYHQLDNGKHLYEFEVPMAVEADRITAAEAFNIRIDVFISVPGCDTDPDASIMTSNMRTHTSADYRPRLDMATLDPLAIEYIHPQIVGDDLVIHTAMSSPWGNYDVNEAPDGIQVKITGPSEARSLVRTAFVQRHHEHGQHFQPVAVTFSWPYQLDQAADGEYTIEVRASNDQGTAEAVGRALFDIGRNVGVDSEGNTVEQVKRPSSEASPLPLLPVVALVAVAAVLRRR